MNIKKQVGDFVFWVEINGIAMCEHRYKMKAVDFKGLAFRCNALKGPGEKNIIGGWRENSIERWESGSGKFVESL